MDRARANRIAHTIRDYWQRLGVPVNVWVVSENEVGTTRKEGSPDEFTVRSDLVNGLPQNMSAPAFKRLAAAVYGFNEAQTERLPSLTRGVF